MLIDRPAVPPVGYLRRSLRGISGITHKVGEAAMGHLSETRGTKKLSSTLLALIALSALLATWAPVPSVSVGAAPAWASGSPDETLNPQTGPKSAPVPTTTYVASTKSATAPITTSKYTWKSYLLMAWKYLAVSRF